MVGCFNGFSLLRLKRSSSRRTNLNNNSKNIRFSFGSCNNKVKEDDVLRAYDILQDLEQQQKKNHNKILIENESSTSNHKSHSLNTTMIMSSFFNNYYEDTTSSSSNDSDEHYIYQESQSNTNSSECVKVPIDDSYSSQLAKLHEYEEMYFSNVYVHNNEKEDYEQNNNETRSILDLLPFYKMTNNENYTKENSENDNDNDEENEDGWSDTETVYDVDDNSWLIDIDLPALLYSKQQESINNTMINDHFNSDYIVDNLEEWFQKLEHQTKNLIECNEKLTTETKYNNNAKLQNQIILTKNKIIQQTTSNRDIVFHVDDSIVGDVSSSSVNDPLTPCFHTFKCKQEKKQEKSMNALLDHLNISVHTSATIFFDDTTNHSFDSFIRMKRRMISLSSSPKNQNNNNNNRTTTITTMNHIESELDMLLNETLHEKSNTHKTQQQQQQQYNIEYEIEIDNDQSEKMLIGGIVYNAKDIERAWNEVVYSQNLQQDDIVLNQLHDFNKNNNSFNCRGLTPINNTNTIQASSSCSLRQHTNDYLDIYKRYQNQMSNNNYDYGIHHEDAPIIKCEINERIEI